MEALQAVKREMKPKSKNELIRIIGVLLIDKHSLVETIKVLESKLNQLTPQAPIEGSETK